MQPTAFAGLSGNSFTIALPRVSDKKLGLVPLNLHIWVLLQEQYDITAWTTDAWWCQAARDRLFLPPDLNVETINGATLLLMRYQTGRGGAFVVTSTSDYSFARNGVETGTWYTWP